MLGVGGIDTNGNMFAKKVVKRDAGTLTTLLLEYVLPGSIIYSDQWRGYNLVSDHFEHHQVNHSENFVNPIDGTNTQKIESTWRVLKSFVDKKGARKCENLDWYLAEFSFRKKTTGDFFFAFPSLIKG